LFTDDDRRGLGFGDLDERAFAAHGNVLGQRCDAQREVDRRVGADKQRDVLSCRREPAQFSHHFIRRRLEVDRAVVALRSGDEILHRSVVLVGDGDRHTGQRGPGVVLRDAADVRAHLSPGAGSGCEQEEKRDLDRADKR